jgi:hypothetical protein
MQILGKRSIHGGRDDNGLDIRNEIEGAYILITVLYIQVVYRVVVVVFDVIPKDV